MDVTGVDTIAVLCHDCGATAPHHEFVKPGSPSMGLVCGRCGNVLEVPESVPSSGSRGSSN